MADYEISVQDGHLHIRLERMENGWYATVESDIEGAVFQGHVTELSDLLAGDIPSQSSGRGEDKS